MGCDIHAYLEYKKKVENSYWMCFSRVNITREYSLFGSLSKGVRTNIEGGLLPRGIPSDLSYVAEKDYTLVVVPDDEYGDGFGWSCSESDANSWMESGISRRWYGSFSLPGDDSWTVTHPDWHSASWAEKKDLEIAYKAYQNTVLPEYLDGKNIPLEVIIAAMVAYEQNGYYSRLVYWFDN